MASRWIIKEHHRRGRTLSLQERRSRRSKEQKTTLPTWITPAVGESEYDYSNYDLTVPSSGDEYTQCDSQAETQRI